MIVKPKLKIIIDTREKKLIEKLKDKKESIEFEVQQLDVADIIVSQNVAIERKEGFDLLSSLVDNRLFEQIYRLKEAYPKPVLIIEKLNDEVFNNTGIKKSSIYGALCKISCDLGVSIIPTRNLDDTIIVIERLAYREQVKRGEALISRKAPKNMSLEERRAFIIEGLLDIGPKKAKVLIEKFKTPFKVFQAIKNTSIIHTKSGNPKGIKGPLSEIPGFGWKFIAKNKELLFGKINDIYQKTLDEIGKKSG